MSRNLALPTAEQVAWHDMEIGMFIHWAPFVYQDEQSDALTTPMEVINPDGFNAEAWVQCALGLGAKYIILVAKHCDGFCLWQTETCSYGVKNIKWRDGTGDIVKEVSDACRRHGLKLGVYLSPMDRYLGAKVNGICQTPEAQNEYDTIYRQQLTELLTRYGEMAEVWFDGSTRCEISDILHEHAPHIIVFQSRNSNIRWVGNEDGIARYPAWNSVSDKANVSCATILDSDPDGSTWKPLECDTTIREGWFWSKRRIGTTKSLEHLMNVYYNTVGNGAVLLLNSNPDSHAVMPEEDEVRMKELGDAVRQLYASRVAATAGEGSMLELCLNGMQAIDHIILMEDIRFGERVRRYQVEGWNGHAWITLASGTAIGHKRIHPIRETLVERLRFTAERYAASPIMRDFSACLARLPFAPAALPDSKADTFPVFQWGMDLFYGDGRLKGRELVVDLTGLLIDESDVGQYEIRLQTRNGRPAVITAATLEMSGAVIPGYVDLRSQDTLRITVPGIDRKTVLRIIADMPDIRSEGTVLMTKL